MRWMCVLGMLICMAVPVAVNAHGAKGEVSRGGIVVLAQYDTGEPMSYAKVEIYAPDSQAKFQTGRTDRNGKFSFIPDVPGEWKVIVDDEMDHRLIVVIPVNESLEPISTGSTEKEK
jgi:nickel transport protein